ncbi:MAG: hypothetical protein M1832_003339 [Thelocarpon impressellum]|nr:MAG: hypothetical protein M1832_003339 [Thelocarpon impressellum]
MSMPSFIVAATDLSYPLLTSPFHVTSALLAVRRRFFDNYRRCVLKLPDFNAAADGNGTVVGNVLFDAACLGPSIGEDSPTPTFIALYGLHPSEVPALSRKRGWGDCMAVLNEYASRVANERPVSSAFEAAFVAVLEGIHTAGRDLRSARDPSSPLGAACEAFWAEHRRAMEAECRRECCSRRTEDT